MQVIDNDPMKIIPQEKRPPPGKNFQKRPEGNNAGKAEQNPARRQRPMYEFLYFCRHDNDYFLSLDTACVVSCSCAIS